MRYYRPEDFDFIMRTSLASIVAWFAVMFPPWLKQTQ